MQTDVTNSAPAINETIIFGIGDVPPDSFRISLTLTDDQVAFEVVEMYTASLEIISGTNIVMLGTPEETVINIIGDGENCSVFFMQMFIDSHYLIKEVEFLSHHVLFSPCC